jgi:putative endonuclease
MNARKTTVRRCGIGVLIIEFPVPNVVRDPYWLKNHAISKVFYVYILASLSGTLYVGLTDDLRRRVDEHKLGLVDSFTKKYNVNRLMYFEIFHDGQNAAQRERQIKKYRREKKIALFAKTNPDWQDLGPDLSKSTRELLM